MSEPKKNEKKAAAGRLGGLAGGKMGGQSKSEAKVRASKINGAISAGRPKGIPTTKENATKAALARAIKLTPERRKEIAMKAAAASAARRKKSA